MAALQPVRTRLLVQADRRSAVQLRHVGGELMRLREDAALSVREVGRGAKMSAAHVLDAEAGRATSWRALGRIAAVLGAEVSIRVYPTTGPRIRDRFQAPIVEALIGLLHERWSRHLEVVVGAPGRGVIDLVIGDAEACLLVAAEIESGLRRIEQRLRWSHGKAAALANTDLARLAAGDPEQGATISQLLVLRSTVETRRLVAQFAGLFAAEFPARTVDAYGSLVGEAPWPGPALVWARVEGGRAVILNRPPRGVPVGR